MSIKKILLIIDHHQLNLHDFLYEKDGIKNIYDTLDPDNKSIIFYESEGKPLDGLNSEIFRALETDKTANVIRLAQGIVQFFGSDLVILKSPDDYNTFIVHIKEVLTSTLQIIKAYIESSHHIKIDELIKNINSILVDDIKNLQIYVNKIINNRYEHLRNSFLSLIDVTDIGEVDASLDILRDKITKIITIVDDCINLIKHTIYKSLDFIQYDIDKKTYDDIYNRFDEASFFSGIEKPIPIIRVIDDIIIDCSTLYTYRPELRLIIAYDRTKVMFKEISNTLKNKIVNAIVIGGQFHLYDPKLSLDMKSKVGYSDHDITIYEMIKNSTVFENYPIILDPCPGKMQLCNNMDERYDATDIKIFCDMVNLELKKVVPHELEIAFLNNKKKRSDELKIIEDERIRKENEHKISILQDKCLIDKIKETVVPYFEDDSKYIMALNITLLALGGKFEKDTRMSDKYTTIYSFIRHGGLISNKEYYLKFPTNVENVTKINCISIMMLLSEFYKDDKELIIQSFKTKSRYDNQGFFENADQFDLINTNQMSLFDQIKKYIEIGDTLSSKDFEDPNNYKIKKDMELITDINSFEKQIMECANRSMSGGFSKNYQKYMKYKRKYLKLKLVHNIFIS
ncbi:MAG: hypothetical protein Edafosvirus2_35 [Edafosvirus sp.]|uniref:Uncharacterized protein n=1 Tax=Edafosvirus sp. TaxID=2487765 RepID=A0A3G4ZSI4_9VIRU|nr:MAG: hypothetical protein Edafosvirus2_35 [Edafosvirus sp.]